jgi:hypothetical protein
MTRAHRPTEIQRRQVETMAGYGVPEADIARVLAIDTKTLRKRYRDEIDTGHIRANAKVAENLFRKATGDGREAVVAAIFWLKTRARWKETTAIEHSGAGGAPIESDVTVKFVQSAREQLGARIAALGERAHEATNDRGNGG